jgi:hypothetical protein
MMEDKTEFTSFRLDSLPISWHNSAWLTTKLCPCHLYPPASPPPPACPQAAEKMGITDDEPAPQGHQAAAPPRSAALQGGAFNTPYPSGALSTGGVSGAPQHPAPHGESALYVSQPVTCPTRVAVWLSGPAVALSRRARDVGTGRGSVRPAVHAAPLGRPGLRRRPVQHTRAVRRTGRSFVRSWHDRPAVNSSAFWGDAAASQPATASSPTGSHGYPATLGGVELPEVIPADVIQDWKVERRASVGGAGAIVRCQTG